jgi:hypothetical protein
MSRGGSNKAGPPRLQQRARRPVELEEDHHLRAPGAERGGGGCAPCAAVWAPHTSWVTPRGCRLSSRELEGDRGRSRGWRPRRR